jgi:magnesium chelatase family protein
VSLAYTRGAVLHGVAAAAISVEVDISSGLPAIGIVGLPGASVNEARWRVRTAVRNSGFAWPDARVTFSLSPAEVPKHGSGLDLPMAMAVIIGQDRIRPTVENLAFIGELGLDGSVHRVRGALAMLLSLVDAGASTVVVPAGNARECSLVRGVTVLPVGHLRAACAASVGDLSLVEFHGPGTDSTHIDQELNLADVVGQEPAKYALEVAAAGGHHIWLTGVPGVGKTMLAERLPSILPDLTESQSREVTVLHSVAGAIPDALVSRPPWQAPHHSSSASAIIGSVRGAQVHPGAATLAHHGVLFLDEAPEFHRDALEAMRQSMESGVVHLHRAQWSGKLPARAQVVFASNPCKCGAANAIDGACNCPQQVARQYRARISGPLRSRIDITVQMDAIISDLQPDHVREDSQLVRHRVTAAREAAAQRMLSLGIACNAHISPAALEGSLALPPAARAVIRSAGLPGMRAQHRAMRVAWTITDLRGGEAPSKVDAQRAIALVAPAEGFAA